MAYDIISDDVFDSNEKPPRRKGRHRQKIQNLFAKIKPFYIHLTIIIILIVALFFFFMSDFSFDFDEPETGLITLLGSIDNFSENYTGTLEIYSARFTIETNAGTFAGASQDMVIENFTGKIFYINDTIQFDGVAKQIIYGSNKLNMNSDKFELISKGKTKLNLEFEKIDFVFKDGKAKLDSSLSYDFDDSEVSVTNFNTTMTYDGTFSFTGKPNSLNIYSPKQNLKISLEN